jgi:multidrug efflux pump subunit AcrB
MRSFFHAVTHVSLRFRAVTLTLVVVVLSLGAVAGSQLKQELLPPIEFPQTFILAQVSGMTSDQVLNVITRRLEAEIMTVPEIVNLESTTTSAIGAVMIAANDFGLNQARLRDDIQTAIDRVWFPSREFRAPDGVDGATFARARLSELPAEVWLYWQRRNGNFLFELSPQVWETLSDEALNAVLGYLANQLLTSGGEKSALERLVEQEIVPQLNAVPQVANVQIAGGQTLPGEEDVFGGRVADAEARSYLLQLSPQVWRVLQARVPNLGEQTAESVEKLKDNPYVMPTGVPALPENWQGGRFLTAQDIVEVQTATRTTAGVLANFLRTGVIKGALGQTDDLTADDITRMLAIDPTMVNAFKAEHLVAMPQEAFEAIPKAYIESLDSFAQDELAAQAVARALAGASYVPTPINLPNAWRIQPPQIITFSLASLPLVTFSIFSTSELDVAAVATPTTDVPVPTTPSDTTAQPTQPALPVGPELPQLFTLLGQFFGAELNTADDLVRIQVSGALAEQFGIQELRGADFFNQLTQFSAFSGGAGVGGVEGLNIAQFVPALAECGFGLLDINPQNPDFARIVLGCVRPDVMSYLVANDPQFMPALNASVFEYFTDDVLALEGVTPPLTNAWSSLAEQLEGAQKPLRSAKDLLDLGNGRASEVLNAINANVPSEFAGYEVRLFDSLTPATVRYFALKEEGFFANLDEEVVLKFAPSVLAIIPQDVVVGYDAATVETLRAIVSGSQPSAGTVLAERYQVSGNVPPTDPTAPALNAEWGQLTSFVAVDQLANASDFFRLPATSGTPAQFINNLMIQAPPAFARSLVAGLTKEAIDYIQGRDATFLDSLTIVTLQALNPDVLAQLPQSIQDRVAAGEIFVPTTAVTRTNGAPSLLVTLTKDQNANTVEAFYAVKNVIDKIDAENNQIAVAVAFEQSSFVEESITGVVREGTMGAFFAVIVILVFLSTGEWSKKGQRVTGIAVMAVALGVLAVLVAVQWNNAGGDLLKAWNSADTVLRVLGLGGVFVGLFVAFSGAKLAYPSWRSTLVIAISIPLSIAVSLSLMRWFPSILGALVGPLAEDGNAFFQFILRLAPANLTLNIMTLSGLTVAVGRVVDDSIVVLENITRQMQERKVSKREAILSGVRDVSAAIFSATVITVIVFLPLGLTGGLVGEFFLPFGLAVTYSLLASFVVAVTVVPVLVEMFINESDTSADEDVSQGRLQRAYVATLKLALQTPLSRALVLIGAFASAGVGVWLFSGRPATFLPDFGEPQIAVSLNLPQGTSILETDKLARELEALVQEVIPQADLKTLQTLVGSGGFNLASLIGGGRSVTENVAQITATMETTDDAQIDAYTRKLRDEALKRYGEEIVSVSKSNLTSQGFGSFEMVLSGQDQAVLAQLDQCILRALSTVEGLANVSSNLSSAGLETTPCPTVSYLADGTLTAELREAIQAAVLAQVAPDKAIVRVFERLDGIHVDVSAVDAGVLAKHQGALIGVLNSVSGLSNVRETENLREEATGEGGAIVYFRINGAPALSYTGEIESADTINLVTRAINTVQAQVELPTGYTVGQGFDSQFQTEGFAGIFVAIGIAGAIVCAILVLVFASPIYWLAVILSVVVAPVGAAVALTLSDRELGISSLIGLLMLLGLVVTNAVVLIDRVRLNISERNMGTHEALVEAGERRLRPILMTALATIFALLPLALGLSRGALIAESLGTVVIGGLVSSTLLTLIVVPTAYYVFTPIHNWLLRKNRVVQTTASKDEA